MGNLKTQIKIVVALFVWPLFVAWSFLSIMGLGMMDAPGLSKNGELEFILLQTIPAAIAWFLWWFAFRDLFSRVVTIIYATLATFWVHILAVIVYLLFPIFVHHQSGYFMSSAEKTYYRCKLLHQIPVPNESEKTEMKDFCGGF